MDAHNAVVSGTRSSPTARPMIQVYAGNSATDTFFPVTAIIDTGADHCFIRSDIMQRFVVRPATVNARVTLAVGHVNLVEAYSIDMFIKSSDGKFLRPITIEVFSVSDLQTEMILGMHLLQHFDFSMKRDGTFALSWPAK